MPSIFTRIVKGEIPCYKIAENERFFAFLDINPVAKGHTLVIPKHEVDYIFDESDAEIGHHMTFAKHVAAAIKAAIPCLKVGVCVMGLEVPHSHIHLIPLNSEGDMDFRKERPTFTPEEMEAIAESIRKEYK